MCFLTSSADLSAKGLGAHLLIEAVILLEKGGVLADKLVKAVLQAVDVPGIHVLLDFAEDVEGPARPVNGSRVLDQPHLYRQLLGNVLLRDDLRDIGEEYLKG